MRLLFGKKLRAVSFLALAIFLFPLLPSRPAYAASSHKNAYLAAFFDENTCSYKYKAVVSGEELEYSRVASLFPEGYLKRGNNAKKWFIHGLSVLNDKSSRELVSRVTVNDTGYVSVSATKSGKKVTDFGSIKQVGDKDCLPLTFPARGGGAYMESDRVRCQTIIDTLGSDFNSALLFINDGNNYVDPDYFHKMALALVSTSNGGSIVNGYGHTYTITWGEAKVLNGYAKTVDISSASGSRASSSSQFTYAVKKGYKNTEMGELMESDQRNNIALDADSSADVVDTTWVTWEHLFLEAEILYCEGISYQNADDLYEEKNVLNTINQYLNTSLLKLGSDLSIRSAIQLVFNDGIYDTDMYVFGIYKDNVNDIVFTVFLAFAAIMVALLSTSIVRMINERQTLATYSSMSRANLLAEAKNMLLCLFAIAFAWQIFKLLFMLNFYFVKIWFGFLKDNYSFVYYNSTVGFNSLIQIALIVVYLYIDIMYILRSLFVPCLMACAPLFLFLYTFGGNFQRITFAWFKELLGAIFMQSIHAFVLTFVMMVGQDTRGIAQVIVWASILPLTKLFRDVCGIGGKELFHAAKGLSASAVAGAGSLADAAGSAAGGAMGAAGGVAGGALGASMDKVRAAAGYDTRWTDKLTNIGQSTGSAIGKIWGGGAKTAIGAGGVIASGGEDGANVMSSGIQEMGLGAAQIGAAVGKSAGPGRKSGMGKYASIQVADTELDRMRYAENGDARLKGHFGTGGTPEALYNAPSTLGPSDSLEASVVKQGGILNQPAGVATAKWDTGMTAGKLDELYTMRSLGNTPYDSLSDRNDVFAKLAHDCGNYQALQKNSNGLSKNQITKICQDYQNACNYVGVQNLKMNSRAVDVKSGQENQTIKTIAFEGSSDVNFQ